MTTKETEDAARKSTASTTNVKICSWPVCMSAKYNLPIQTPSLGRSLPPSAEWSMAVDETDASTGPTFYHNSPFTQINR